MLRPPSGEDALQERLIPDVPVPLARRIAEDFLRRLGGSPVGRYTLYRIEDPTGERLLPMDFGEITSILYQEN
jgi:hypothetical protein